MWAISAVLTVEALDGLPSPLLGVALGLIAAVPAYGAGVVVRRSRQGLGAVARRRWRSRSWPRRCSRSPPGAACSRSTTPTSAWSWRSTSSPSPSSCCSRRSSSAAISNGSLPASGRARARGGRCPVPDRRGVTCTDHHRHPRARHRRGAAARRGARRGLASHRPLGGRHAGRRARRATDARRGRRVRRRRGDPRRAGRGGRGADRPVPMGAAPVHRRRRRGGLAPLRLQNAALARLRARTRSASARSAPSRSRTPSAPPASCRAHRRRQAARRRAARERRRHLPRRRALRAVLGGGRGHRRARVHPPDDTLRSARAPSPSTTCGTSSATRRRRRSPPPTWSCRASWSAIPACASCSPTAAARSCRCAGACATARARRRRRHGAARVAEDSLRRFFYDTVTFDGDLVRELVAFAGADHVLLGSDYPFDMGDARPVDTVRGRRAGPREGARRPRRQRRAAARTHPRTDRSERMTETADVVVAGAGHNSLITAAYLARAGHEVLVLDARADPGRRRGVRGAAAARLQDRLVLDRAHADPDQPAAARRRARPARPTTASSTSSPTRSPTSPFPTAGT